MANDGQHFDWKEERKYLSKHKHIYQVYRSVDGAYHLEKYPVVYINKFYVYYHVNGSEPLDYVSRSRVHNGIDDNMREILKSVTLSGVCWRRFFWQADDSIIDFLNDCKVNEKEYRREIKLAQLKKEAALCIKRYNETLEDIRKLEAQGNESDSRTET